MARPLPTENARDECFATCAPGLEPLLHAEVKELRLARTERQVGGVRFDADRRDLWRCNLSLRTAVRVLRRVARFHAPSEDELYRGLFEIEWERWLGPDGSLFVDAQTKDSGLSHSRYAEQRVKDAICDRFRERTGTRPSVDREDPDLRVHLHLYADRATVSLDSSGPSLHKRGWRVHQGRAPLAETTAAAVVLLSDWDRRAPLIDPFCGSGTLLVEAALIASDTPPGAFRRFAFERWPDHDEEAWGRLREEAVARASLPPKVRLLGYDSSPEQVDGARANASAAGFADRIELATADARELSPKAGWNAWIVSNLPYGERVGNERELRRTYADFGAALRRRCSGFHYALLTSGEALIRALALPGARVAELRNGALDCRLLVGRIE